MISLQLGFVSALEKPFKPRCRNVLSTYDVNCRDTHHYDTLLEINCVALMKGVSFADRRILATMNISTIDLIP